MNDLPYILAVGTVFSHNKESNFYKYVITNIEFGDKYHNDKITLQTLETPDINDVFSTFDVEPRWFEQRKIKFNN
nr:hypothetical protein [Mycobacterium sp. E3298]